MSQAEDTPRAVRVIILFDGANWFYALRDHVQRHGGSTRLRYGLFAAWILGQVRHMMDMPEDAALVSETHYFTSVPDPVCEETPHREFRMRLLRFLDALRMRDGVQIHEYETRDAYVTCSKCENTLINYQEEEVDVAIAVELVGRAAHGVVDVVVLVTGDSDLIPAVIAAKREGVRVFVAGLPGPNISVRLRNTATGFIDLTEGLSASVDVPEVPSGDDDLP